MSIINALPYNIANGQAIDAVPVMANFNEIVNDVNASAATAASVTALAATVSLKAGSGANSDITSLTGLTAALSVSGGGTSVTTLPALFKTVMSVQPIARVGLGSGAPALTNSVFTLVPFNSVVFDNAGWYSTSTFRYTPLTAGYYDVTTTVAINLGGIGVAVLSIYKNGAEDTRGSYIGGQTGYINVTAAGLIFMNGSTDYLDMRAYVNANSSTLVAGNQQTAMFVKLVHPT